MNKKTLFLILSLILVLPSLASAQTIIQGMAIAAERTALFIASAVVVILWIVTGLLFLTARGAPEGLTKAKTSLLAAVAGTLLVIVAGSAIALVGQMFGIS